MPFWARQKGIPYQESKDSQRLQLFRENVEKVLKSDLPAPFVGRALGRQRVHTVQPMHVTLMRCNRHPPMKRRLVHETPVR